MHTALKRHEEDRDVPEAPHKLVLINRRVDRRTVRHATVSLISIINCHNFYFFFSPSPNRFIVCHVEPPYCQYSRSIQMPRRAPTRKSRLARVNCADCWKTEKLLRVFGQPPWDQSCSGRSARIESRPDNVVHQRIWFATLIFATGCSRPKSEEAIRTALKARFANMLKVWSRDSLESFSPSHLQIWVSTRVGNVRTRK